MLIIRQFPRYSRRYVILGVGVRPAYWRVVVWLCGHLRIACVVCRDTRFVVGDACVVGGDVGVGLCNIRVG